MSKQQTGNRNRPSYWERVLTNHNDLIPQIDIKVPGWKRKLKQLIIEKHNREMAEVEKMIQQRIKQIQEKIEAQRKEAEAKKAESK